MGAVEVVNDLLADLYPGDDPVIAGLRKELARVSGVPGSAVVLLEGPPGSGKTTMARTIAVCRRIFTGPASELSTTLEHARREILTQKPLTWYRDISLAGLVETLAEAQLFGIGPKVATEVSPRIGLFEQAMTGHDPSEPAEASHAQLVAAAREKRRWTPLVTGGVVLLDEIGDLRDDLQAKLLRVLNGERQYRLGKEGNDGFSFQFRGVAILATWRALGSKEGFRRDLWQRICHNRIQVPSLSFYSVSSRAKIIRALSMQFQDLVNEELERLHDMEAGVKSDICSPDWLVRLKRLGRQTLSPETEARLSELDWGLLGEFRGLRSVVHRLLLGSPVGEAIESVRSSTDGAVPASLDSMQWDVDILRRVLSVSSISAGWKEYRLEWAKRINQMLVKKHALIEGQINESSKTRNQVKKEIENLLRSDVSDDSTQ